MHIRQQGLPIVLVALAMLAWSPGDVRAQGRGHRFGTEGGTGHQHHTGQGLEPQMQQMGGLILQMAERVKAGPLTPDQALHLSGMLEQLATIMNKMAAGIAGTDVSTQLETMKTRLADMQPHTTSNAGSSANAEAVQPSQQP